MRKSLPRIMLTVMTLYGRNVFFRIEIVMAALFLILTGILAFKVLPACPAAMADSARRSPGIIQGLIARFLEPSPYIPVVSVAAGGLFSCVALVLIYFSFEKTQAPEILFISLFVLPFSFEALRLLMPLQKIRAIPSVYLLLAFRLLLFGRFFGIFALFAAGVYAAGLEVQKQLNVILIAVFVSLVVALGVPIDIFTWDSSFSVINGYLSLFRMIESVILIMTMMSFFISAWSRGTREYIAIGAGSFLACAGRNILLSGDTWISPLPGVLLLAAGTWLISTKLHKVYLWL